MSKYSNHSEHIASYLEGHMSPGQMQEFEKQLNTDPILRSEFELQKDIIHSIKDFRKSQLKTKLDEVPVNIGHSPLAGVKVAAALVISGVIGVGAYLYLSSPESVNESASEAIAPIEQLQVEPELLTELPEVLPTEDLISTEEVTEEVTKAEEATPDLKPASEPIAKSPEVVEPEVEETDLVVNSPKLTDPNTYPTDIEETIEIPTAALAQDGLADNHVVAVETAKKDSDLFHYQYYSGKLYLYGDFRDIPYEILELNSNTGKRLFIYYDNAYYKIKDNQQSLTPLEALTDQDIIKKLEIIQANK